MALSIIDLGTMVGLMVGGCGFIWHQMARMERRLTERMDRMESRHAEQMKQQAEQLKKTDERLTEQLRLQAKQLAKMDDRLVDLARDLHKVDNQVAHLKGRMEAPSAAEGQALISAILAGKIDAGTIADSEEERQALIHALLLATGAAGGAARTRSAGAHEARQGLGDDSEAGGDRHGHRKQCRASATPVDDTLSRPGI